jgi:hypothetical protein
MYTDSNDYFDALTFSSLVPKMFNILFSMLIVKLAALVLASICAAYDWGICFSFFWVSIMQ